MESSSSTKMDSLISLFVTLFLLFIFFFFFFFNWVKKNESKKLPPSPTKLPIIGNLHLLGKLPHRSLLTLSKKIGDPMFLQLGSIPTLIISSPKTAQDIFKNHDLVFSNRPSLYAANKLTHNASDISFAPYGDYWREIRKIAVLELFTIKRVESFGKIRAEEVNSMMDEIERCSPGPVDLNYLAFRLANAFVCRVAFGIREGHESRRRFQRILLEVQLLIAEFNVADYFPGLSWVNKINGVDKRIEKVLDVTERFFDQLIAEHREKKMKTEAVEKNEEDEEDVIDMVLRVQNDPNQTLKLTDHHIKGLFMDILAAGTDTLSSTIVWTMGELMRNPQSRTKLQQELRQNMTGKQESIQENDLSNLNYLKLVIKESLRVHPPAPLMLPRETSEPSFIAGKYEIPAKTRVIINAAALSMDDEYWERPQLFSPERFADNDIDYKGQHFGYLPFGAGRRGCPGINFAIPLVELAVANLVFRYDWEFPVGMTAEDLNMDEEIGLTVSKKVPLLLIPKLVTV